MFENSALRRASIKNDVLSGLTVSLALVPEAVAFALIAGVGPLVGLYAAFILEKSVELVLKGVKL